jgi:hypothetical protein
MRKHEIRLPFHRVAWLTAAALVFVLILTASPAAAQLDPGEVPVAGKWSRGAADSVAWVDLATWKLVTRMEQPFVQLSDPEPEPWIPVAGDWDGDGVDTVLMFNVQTWELAPLEKGPFETVAVEPKPLPGVPVAGDWEGRGIDTVLVFDLRDGSLRRPEDRPIKIDPYDPDPNPWRPVVGDWDGRGRDTVATYRDDERAPDLKGAWTTVAGDWQGRGFDSVAFVHGPTGTLVQQEMDLGALATKSSRTAGRASFLDNLQKSGSGSGGCYQKATGYSSVTKVFHYGVGGCMIIVLENWTQLNCCPIDLDGTHYSCSHILKFKTHTYAYTNC